jgi:cytochrome P450 PksS
MALLSLFHRRRSPLEPVNIASPEFKADPFPFYARLRAEAPVYRTVLPTGEPVWLVTRYDDAVAVLKDERFVKNAANAMTPAQLARRPWFRKLLRPMQPHLLHLDGQDHLRLRVLVNKAFTPRLVERMHDRIQALSEESLEPALARGRLELIGEFALPLPLRVIADILGVPAEERQAFQRWSEAIMSGYHSSWGLMKALPKALLLLRYIRRLIRRRRAEPQDDLVSALTRVEEAGERLSEGVLVGMVFLLLLAGYETTVNLIGNGMLALLEHPDQLARLRDDPALIKSAVEELLRFTSPVETTLERYAREDVRIGGVTIPRGEMVYVALASANRDERQFANADVLDITREPNKHLAFGLGAHFCVGAPLGRLEGQIAIGTLLRWLPDVRLAVAPQRLRWRRGLLLRGLEALPLAFGPANRPAKPDPLSVGNAAS